MASQREIAKACGVSVSTVSRVLGGAGEKFASPDLSRRIWEAAKTLGYSPNPAARALRLGEGAGKRPLRLATVLARVPDTESDPFFRALAQAVDEEVVRQGCVPLPTLTLAQVLERGGRALEDASPDGVLILGRCPGEAARRLGRSRPAIAVGLNPSGQSEIDQVLCSGRQAARMAMDHLLGQGHTRIAYLGECSSENRFGGYCDTLLEKGLALDRSLVLETSQTAEGGRRGARRILSLKNPPTALFCANDNLAMGAVRELKARGISVPGDMGVISIDDIEPAQMIRPQLTTIHIPKDDMGRLAVRLLLDRIGRGHTERLELLLPCRLVRRESS